MSTCPMCKGNRFRYELRSAGIDNKTKYYKTGVKKSWLFPSGKRNVKSNRIQKTYGYCPDCGYLTDKPLIQNASTPSRTSFPKHREKSSKGLLIVLFLLVVAAFGRDKTSSQRDINDFQIKKQAEENVPEEIAEYLSDENGSEEHAEYLLGDWATADLEDFEFEYQDGGIILEKYNGDNASVIIPSFYEVENTVLPVLKLDKTFSWNRNIINIIISEGVTNITSNTFYQCDSLKHLYIPASIDNLEKSISFIKNGEVLYYGGTEEKWMELNTVSWSEIHFKRVIYNAVADDCINNKDMVVADDQKMIASDCAPLSDFRYDLVEGGICLKDYIGKKSFIKISDNYYINGREYPVKVLDTTFALTNIYAVSVPEGVTTIEIATFNSCGIKKLYLPSSLSKVTGTFWHYFHDLNTLYYGGSEEQFERLLGDVDRWDLDIKHIKYNAIPDDVFKK